MIPYPLPKRLLDKAVAAALLALSLPVILLVLAAMSLDTLLYSRDRGSFLYREPRISRGRAFDLFKFRTLRSEALERAGGHARLLEADAENLTLVGRRILNPWYLDELPQLLNVLRGDISLVGPRPWPPELVERQVAEGRDYRRRIVAGLTGRAQVTKGARIPYEELDLEYVRRAETLSTWALVRYDLGILRKTVRVITRGEGLNY